MDWRIDDDSPIHEICVWLAHDGYPCDAETADRVRTAYREGRLLWTRTQLVIVGTDAVTYFAR